MSNKNEDFDNLTEKELKAELQNKTRIENYLRSEVSNLWSELNRINALPFNKLYQKIASKLQKNKPHVNLTKNINISQNKISNHDEKIKNKKSYDFIFVMPTNNLELGGVKVANSLASELQKIGKSVGIIPILSDPSVSFNPLLITDKSIESVSTVVSCGAETTEYAKNIQLKFNSNFQLFMQGPDFLFTPKWKNAKEFLAAIKTANSIVCVSPYLEKLANSLGGKNIQTIIFGPDTKIFNFKNLKREKVIMVPCRRDFTKGLRNLLPNLNLLQNFGYKTIGFGDIEDASIANYFDEFLGRITQERLSEYLNCAELIFDPSLIEGLGLITLEAAHCGCIPIVQKRESYEKIFDVDKKPFIEINDFLDPNEIINSVKLATSTLSSELVRSRVKDITFQNGFNEYIKLKH